MAAKSGIVAATINGYIFQKSAQDIYNRLSEISDGAVCIYADYGITGHSVWNAEADPPRWDGDFDRWGHMIAADGPYNKPWEALTEWQADQLAA